MKNKKIKIAKTISSKAIIEILNDKKDRFEYSSRYERFKEELSENVNRYNTLASELSAVSHKINDLRHLIKMYKINDDHRLFDIWKLELALGITDKKWMTWNDELKKTEAGKLFNNGHERP